MTKEKRDQINGLIIPLFLMTLSALGFVSWHQITSNGERTHVFYKDIISELAGIRAEMSDMNENLAKVTLTAQFNKDEINEHKANPRAHYEKGHK